MLEVPSQQIFYPAGRCDGNVKSISRFGFWNRFRSNQRRCKLIRLQSRIQQRQGLDKFKPFSSSRRRTRSTFIDNQLRNVQFVLTGALRLPLASQLLPRGDNRICQQSTREMAYYGCFNV